MKLFCFISILLLPYFYFAQSKITLAVLKYNGGGDYYANPTALPNLIKFCNNSLETNLNEEDVPYVEAGSKDLFRFPFIHMTGHGNVFFTQEESENLRNYLLSGGFIHIDDNYGMDEYLRKELIKIFPNKELVELSRNHPIFKNPYNFPQGLPKIHEHDKNRPQAFGIYEEDRLLVLYTFESDLGDGWENPEIHNDPQEIRLNALQMGANIINYVFIN